MYVRTFSLLGEKGEGVVYVRATYTENDDFGTEFPETRGCVGKRAGNEESGNGVREETWVSQTEDDGTLQRQTHTQLTD